MNTTALKFPINHVIQPYPTDVGANISYYKNTLFVSGHMGGAQFVFGDGSVHFLSESINFATLTALADRADGAAVGEF